MTADFGDATFSITLASASSVAVLGAKTWIAKITGRDKTYRFQREFCDGRRPRERGILRFKLRGAGVYEYRNFGKHQRSGFLRIDGNGGIEEITKNEALSAVTNVVDRLAEIAEMPDFDGPQSPWV